MSLSLYLHFTNDLCVHLSTVKRIMQACELEHYIVIHPNTTAVIQYEAGAAIKGAHGVNVSRSRFLPVKSCSDLLLIKSDVYLLQHGHLVINPNRMFETTPVIKLGDHFKKIAQFQKRFMKIPHIIDLDHLTVTGDVYFRRNVTLRGTVIANEGHRINIPDGCVLENREPLIPTDVCRVDRAMIAPRDMYDTRRISAISNTTHRRAYLVYLRHMDIARQARIRIIRSKGV
ncbi:hypothetical protein CERSUDRAFT_162082 [Gelatoporia subvermispora B]|uniref:UTP--glucose-1-phosphate uridylyltransferase n=1 Tax=Ceriporiopsis subvermispora (strain B) TaxID=914234 RepID=M2QZN0_CERS8|nr:hypothetical protein CERSUDRAFT_162082 [Gelatoporia subvermispora B]